MNTFELESLLKNNLFTRKVFEGVYAADIIPDRKHIKKPLIIVNTHPKNMKGEHWLAFYVSRNKLEIFDSSGSLQNRKNVFLKKYLKKNFSGVLIEFNTGYIQSFDSNICGIYCAVFGLYRARKKSFKSFLNLFDSSNLVKNDAKVMKIFKKNFRYPDEKKLSPSEQCLQISKTLSLCKHFMKNRK